MDNKIKIVSIFESINGEVTTDFRGSNAQGQLAMFIRCGFCPVGCQWCDTKYSWKEQSDWVGDTEISDIVERVSQSLVDNIVITGGEPTIWHGKLINLCAELTAIKPSINIYTSGCYPLEWRNQLSSGIRQSRLHFVVDYKPKSCQPKMPTLLENLKHLNENDWFKCVLTNKEDFTEYADILEKYAPECKLAVSAAFPSSNEFRNAIPEWMKERNMVDVNYYVQLHRVIWPEQSASNSANNEV